jgi:single-stranded-DNA-specific exonuclease
MGDKQLIVRTIPDSSLLGKQDFDPVFWRVLVARGVKSETEIQYLLGNMLDIDKIRHLQFAAELLAGHVIDNNRVFIFGDYDADGATSTALCVRALRLLGHENVGYLMPDRFIDGYGLSTSAAKRIASQAPDCLITVDNGIASFDGVDLLRVKDIDVIVTDHHLPASELPNASVIVNQNAWDDEAQGKNLAGVGVAFYLMLALRGALRARGWFNDARPEPNLATCLDLVAIGTLADLVPLDYNNRILVNEGLQRIRAGYCSEGVKALIELSKKIPGSLTSTDIGFSIAPKINAAGRLDDMTVGVQCLLADSRESALLFANKLNDINVLRKKVQQKMTIEAEQQFDALGDQGMQSKYAIVLYQADWHEGIVGIVAARIREKYHRPGIVFAKSEDGYLKGSGRSVPGIHLRDMLDIVDKRYPGLILKFGGHAMAAGLSLEQSGLEQFSEAFTRVISDSVDPDFFAPTIECDGSLDNQHFNLEFARALQNLSPWGQRFPIPSFVGEFYVINQRVLADRHLKLVLSPSQSGDSIDAIAFSQPESALNTSYNKIKIHYELNLNQFRGIESLQLLIRDIL